MLVDSFIYIEYVKRMRNTNVYPFGTSKSHSLLLKLLNNVVVGCSSKIQVKSKCTCPGVPKEFEVGSECDICRSHEDDDEGEIDSDMTYSEVCKHYFHRKCLINHLLLEGVKTCPTCRSSFLPLAEFPEWIHNMKKVKACFNSDANERFVLVAFIIICLFNLCENLNPFFVYAEVGPSSSLCPIWCTS